MVFLVLLNISCIAQIKYSYLTRFKISEINRNRFELLEIPKEFFDSLF